MRPRRQGFQDLFHLPYRKQHRCTLQPLLSNLRKSGRQYNFLYRLFHRVEEILQMWPVAQLLLEFSHPSQMRNPAQNHEG